MIIFSWLAGSDFEKDSNELWSYRFILKSIIDCVRISSVIGDCILELLSSCGVSSATGNS